MLHKLRYLIHMRPDPFLILVQGAEIASVLVERGEVMIVSEDRTKLGVCVPALADRLSRRDLPGVEFRVPGRRVLEPTPAPVAGRSGCRLENPATWDPKFNSGLIPPGQTIRAPK